MIKFQGNAIFKVENGIGCFRGMAFIFILLNTSKLNRQMILYIQAPNFESKIVKIRAGDGLQKTMK